LPNAGSVQLHESMGFTRVGVHSRVGFKFGRWQDVLWLELRLSEQPEPKGEPISTEGFLVNPEVLAMFRACAENVNL
jgi:hypothetical protein